MDYYSYKKIYTVGDMFTLSGTPFSGFAQYEGSTVTDADTGNELKSLPTYDTDLFKSRVFKMFAMYFSALK